MRYLVGTLVEWVAKELGNAAPERNKLLFVLPSWDSSLLLYLGKQLAELAARAPRPTRLYYSVAYRLGMEWAQGSPAQRSDLAELQRLGWYNADDNLTSLRNLLPEEKELLLVVLAGFEHITDRHSLQDFYQLDNDALWRIALRGTTSKWVKEKFERETGDAGRHGIDWAISVLDYLYEKALADLPQISGFLDSIKLQEAENARDACRILLSRLSYFGLPALPGLTASGAQKRKALCGSYLEKAREFFNYSTFLAPRKREEYVKKVDRMLVTPDSLVAEDWQLGVFRSADHLLRAVRNYIANREPAMIEDLRSADFVLISDKILGYKPRPEEPLPKRKQRITDVAGLMPEVFLRAVWLTVIDSTDRRNIRGLNLQSVCFKHNFVVDEEGAEQLRSETAEVFLRRLLGGIDGWLTNSLQLGNGEQELKVNISLCPGAKPGQPPIAYATTSGRCGLRFSCTLTYYDGERFTRDFFWPLPMNHPCRVMLWLFRWAYEQFKDSGNDLPLFVLPGVNRLCRVRNEEEAHRLLARALQREDRQVLNLRYPAGGFSDASRAVYGKLKDLSLWYQRFLTGVHDRGLFSALAARGEGELEYEQLARAYRAALKTCLRGEDPAEAESALLLYKAFLVVDGASLSDQNWLWEKSLPAALVTPLHPAMLEMLYYQFSYLAESLCYLVEGLLSGRGSVQPRKDTWGRVVELAAVRRPLGVVFSNRRLETAGRDFAYLQVIGRGTQVTDADELELAEEEVVDDDDDEVSASELFRLGRLALLVKQILADYKEMHAYAEDGLSLAVYAGGSLQQIIAGVDAFVKNLLDARGEEYGPQYGLALTIFSDTHTDWTVQRWLKAWQDSWQQVDGRGSEYLNRCRMVLHYRLVGAEEDYSDLRKLLEEGSYDVVFLADFFKEDESGFWPLPEEMPRRLKNYRYFPVLEKVCCRMKGDAFKEKRWRVLSNRRFILGTGHSRLVSSLQTIRAGEIEEQDLLLVETRHPGAFRQVLETAHVHSVWVVCIDPAMDEHLIASLQDKNGKNPDIIGFGTGVGAHGEANFTVSTTRFYLTEIRKRTAGWLINLFPGLPYAEADRIAAVLLRRSPDERPYLSGLSLVKSTGPERFLREFIAGRIVRLLLVPDQGEKDEKVFSDVLVSLDAFGHWFEGDAPRPDFLHLKSSIVDGRVVVQARLLECKLASENEAHLSKAGEQVKTGLDQLVPRFRPCPPGEIPGVKDMPEQRYWWLQLHRLIASHGIANYHDGNVLAALELLSEGYFDIKWQAGVFTFWTDWSAAEVQIDVLREVELPEDKQLVVRIFQFGRDFIKRMPDPAVRMVQLGEWPAVGYVGLPPEEEPDVDNTSAAVDGGAGVSPAGDDLRGSQGSAGLIDVSTPTTAPEVLGSSGPATPDTTASVGVPPKDMEPELPQASVPGRILLGRRAGGKAVYWEFGHPDLPNRHILVFGASGTGKTYTIQCLLAELGRSGQNSLIVDYTSGFTGGQLDSLFVGYFQPKQHVVRNEPLGVNPFRRQRYLEDGIELSDNPAQVAQRVVGVFNKVYNLGEQQWSTLYNAIREGVEQYGDVFTVPRLLAKLEVISTAGGQSALPALSLVNKLRPFVDMNPLGPRQGGGWEEMFTNPRNRCHIVQLMGFASDMARLITEFILMDLYWFYRSCGSEARPRLVVLDEVQNLDHAEGGSLASILREGRKFGLSLILATQTLSNLKREERDRLFQAAHKLFFRPADTELRSFAAIIADATGERPDDWVSNLASLKRGECYSMGYARRDDGGGLMANHYAKIRVTALSERLGGEDARGDGAGP